MASGLAFPVLAGLVVGASFIILLSIATHPVILFQRQFPDKFQPMIAKARDSEAVKILLLKHPFAHVVDVGEDVTGSGKLVVIRYGGVSTTTWTAYQYSSRLVDQFSTDLIVYVDDKGNIANLRMECAADGGGMSTRVDGKWYGNEYVVQLLKKGFCYS